MQAANNRSVIDTPIGKVEIIAIDKQVVRIDYLPAKSRLISPQDPIGQKAAVGIQKYFSDPKTKFNLDFHLVGTDLQKKIWRFLLKIPVGKTITYGELAKKIETSPRVIGNACRRNPIPIVIPCHRVVAKNGIGGYGGKKGGAKLKIKKWLLKHEA